MKRLLFVCVLLVFYMNTNAQVQVRQPKPTVKHPQDNEAFIKMLDETFLDYYGSISKDKNVDSIIDALELDADDIRDVSNDEYCRRLEKINAISPFQLDCNDITLGMIRFFVKNRRGFAKIVLGRSKLYFDLYETTLAKYDMPIELKYLSVIESGLRPQVKSPAGALGLWQFMYGTGKMYGLVENSYIDERMDPVKATEAACKFLKKLHGIYGDWNLALAAYNAGPGNVNKAIRRSGGKRTYWEVRPYLPRETQGYVPNFIAATYLLTYYVEHNIKPATAKTHYYQLDTICLSKGVHMSTIEQLTQWQSDDIAALNPVYKIRYIPGTEPKQCISGPLNEIGKLVSFGDSLYDLEKFIYSPKAKPTETLDTTNNAISDSTQTTGALEKPVIVWHKVRRGENLTIIADKYYVTVDDIRKWNYLRSNTAPLGRNLKIIKGKAPLNPPSTVTTPSPVQVETKPVQTKPTPKTPKQPITTQVEPEEKPITSQNTKGISSDKPFTSASTTSTESTAPVVFDSIVTIYHTVQRNESIGLIADKYNVTPEQIKEWNKLSTNWIGVAQQLKIKINVKLMQPELANSLKDKTVKPQPKPVEKKRYYTVKPGDIFNRIADSHGITLEELKQLNPKIDPNSIRVGELIRVK